MLMLHLYILFLCILELVQQQVFFTVYTARLQYHTKTHFLLLLELRILCTILSAFHYLYLKSIIAKYFGLTKE